jgi:hypothetical protein
MNSLHNLHEWSLELPHASQHSSSGRRFTISVGAEIVDSYVTGPYMIVNHLGETHCGNILERTHLPLMEDMTVPVPTFHTKDVIG